MAAAHSYRVHIEDVRDRAAAAFLGFALGDALGATAEFMTPGEVKAQFGVLKDIRGGGWLHLPAGEVTDDTEMSLCVAHSILAVGFSPLDIAERFARWLKTRPRDVGATCRRGIRRFLTEGSLVAPENVMDGGNGAVMRMTPIAIASLGDSERLVEWALAQAHITHHQVFSDAASILVGQLIQLALIGQGKLRLRACTDEFLRTFPEFAFDTGTVYSSAYVIDTMRTVLRAFFTTRTFEDCVIETVNWGGDADTTGAIAGGIAGAYYGLDEIPARWLRKLDARVRRDVESVARALVDRSPAAAGSPGLEISAQRVFGLLRGSAHE